MFARNKRPSRLERSNGAGHECTQFFPLLDIPAELRNLVYDYVLTVPEGLKIRWQAGVNRKQKKPVAMVDSEDERGRIPINQLQYTNP